jgi:glycosyltransferase involved in cell wall biosynthesis
MTEINKTRILTAPVSVMVFTLDEEIYLPICLDSLAWCDDVIVVDSFSHDHTIDIAMKAGARVFQNQFTGFGDQRNWAILNTAPKHPWVLILDADERVTRELVEEMANILGSVSSEVSAFRLRRRFHMWGRWLRYSSLYPSWVVRLVKVGCVRFENRGHAETQQVKGTIRDLANDLIDENLKGIDEWFERQNRYSTKDAEYELSFENKSITIGDLLNTDPMIRRVALKKIAMRMPMRPLLYFIYSYFLQGGFRDGRDGLVFCMMRSIYQGMVVAKKHDLLRKKQSS